MFILQVTFYILSNLLILINCEYSSENYGESEIVNNEYSERHSRMMRKRFDWQIPEATKAPKVAERITIKSTTTTTPYPVINVTSMIIRDGTVQINPNEIMHKEEAEGIGDVGIILWGASPKIENTTEQAIIVKGNVMVIPTEHPTTQVSNLEKIMATMPSANEDVIRVLKLADDEQYGKGRAKPKYISMALAHMNSTEYNESDTTNATTEKMIISTTIKDDIGILLDEVQNNSENEPKSKNSNMELTGMNSTEINEETNTTMVTMIMETHSEYSISSQ